MPSASVTAPTRILSQSASVRGRLSVTPFLLSTVPIASNTKSDAGSIMSRISSFTETTGLRSPHSSGAGGGAGDGAAFDEEHAHDSPTTIVSSVDFIGRFPIGIPAAVYPIGVSGATRLSTR